MQIDFPINTTPSLVEFPKRLGMKELTVGSSKAIHKKQRASTIMLNGNRQFRKESINIDTQSFQKDHMFPSIPNTLTETSVKGLNFTNLNNLNFTQTILIQPENVSQIQQRFLHMQDDERDVDNTYQRRGRSQSMKMHNTIISNDSDEYFKEDKDLSMKNSTARGEQDGDNIFDLIKQNHGAIPEQPPEHEISPLKKRKSSKKKIEEKEVNPSVTDKEMKDPPRDLIFRWSQFFEVFIYHVIYYLLGSVFGLIILRIILRGNNIRMIRNLGFYGLKSIQIWEMVFSNLFFAMNVLSAYYVNEMSKVYLVEVFLLFIVLLQRALVVSVKYGKLIIELVIYIYFLHWLNYFMHTAQGYKIFHTKIKYILLMKLLVISIILTYILILQQILIFFQRIFFQQIKIQVELQNKYLEIPNQFILRIQAQFDQFPK